MPFAFCLTSSIAPKVLDLSIASFRPSLPSFFPAFRPEGKKEPAQATEGRVLRKRPSEGTFPSEGRFLRLLRRTEGEQATLLPFGTNPLVPSVATQDGRTDGRRASARREQAPEGSKRPKGRRNGFLRRERRRNLNRETQLFY